MFVIALGFFDGVHKGHGALMERAVQVAAEKGLTPAVITFDRSPMSVVKGCKTPLINSPDDRALLISELYGIDEVIFLHFDRSTMAMPWEEFLDRLIHDFAASHLVCGHDFSCGKGGLGTALKLKERCCELGIGFDIIDAVQVDGVRCSSTVVRELLLCGDVKTANRFLGHPHILTGVVRKGKSLARTFDTPTVNMYFPDDVVVPRYGVYATKVHLPDGSVKTGVTNVGIRPTVEDGLPPTAETFILDYDGDLYGKSLKLDFYDFIRPETKFSGIDELQAQIKRDAKTAQKLLGI